MTNYEVYKLIHDTLTKAGMTDQGGGDNRLGIYNEYKLDDYSVIVTLSNSHLPALDNIEVEFPKGWKPEQCNDCDLGVTKYPTYNDDGYTRCSWCDRIKEQA